MLQKIFQTFIGWFGDDVDRIAIDRDFTVFHEDQARADLPCERHLVRHDNPRQYSALDLWWSQARNASSFLILPVLTVTAVSPSGSAKAFARFFPKCSKICTTSRIKDPN